MKVLDIMDSVISQPRSTTKDNGPVTGILLITLFLKFILQSGDVKLRVNHERHCGNYTN